LVTKVGRVKWQLTLLKRGDHFYTNHTEGGLPHIKKKRQRHLKEGASLTGLLCARGRGTPYVQNPAEKDRDGNEKSRLVPCGREKRRLPTPRAEDFRCRGNLNQKGGKKALARTNLAQERGEVSTNGTKKEVKDPITRKE